MSTDLSVSFDWTATADILGATIVALLRDEPLPVGPAITCTVTPRDSA
ncbi:MAG: hypothetical protein JWN52_3710 [Actinomycetia bacterium]|nr:hypothetical protein [Actinomycetes bacterium]